MADLNQVELEEITSLKQKTIEMLKQAQVMFRTCFDGLMENSIHTLDQVLDEEDKITKVYGTLTASAVEISKKNLSEKTKSAVLDLIDIS